MPFTILRGDERKYVSLNHYKSIFKTSLKSEIKLLCVCHWVPQTWKGWETLLYAQAWNTFTSSQTYQKYSGIAILGNSGRYCSDYKLQEKTERGLIKTSLISSVSHFNLVLKLCLRVKAHKSLRGDGIDFRAPCVARRQTCRYFSDTDNCIFRLNTQKNHGKLFMRWTGFVSTNTRNQQKILQDIFEKRWKQKPSKHQKNTK